MARHRGGSKAWLECESYEVTVALTAGWIAWPGSTVTLPLLDSSRTDRTEPLGSVRVEIVTVGVILTRKVAIRGSFLYD